MKKFVLIMALGLGLLGAKANAQTGTGRYAVFTWDASADQTTGMTYNFKQYAGDYCSSTTLPQLTTIGTVTDLSNLTYEVDNLAIGKYCFAVTAAMNGQESAPAYVSVSVTLAKPGNFHILKKNF